MLTMGVFEVGTSVYAQTAAVAEGMLKTFDIKVRAVPMGGELARVMLGRIGQVDAYTIAGGSLMLWQGDRDYANRAWGPQPVRYVWAVFRDMPSCLATRLDSGIKKVEDIKGKRVARYVGEAGLMMSTEATLAFANLTWKDVKPVDVAGFGDAIKSLIAGKLDVCHVDGGSGLGAQAAAAPGGLYWIPLPIENKEGWKRFRKIYPFSAPMQPKHGINIPKDNTTWYGGVHIPAIFAHATESEDTIYWMAKAIAESLPNYENILKPVMSWWAVESFLKVPKLIPVHNGVIRYLKEKGLWTDEMEAHNKMLLKKEEMLNAAWKATQNEADEKKLSDKKFKELWLKKLDEIRVY
jgi:TRAP transporter TAXI family solute receptor